ncbi:hypothetical protein BC826DRAFT_1068958 [Russula brevipes]|nr:hypothetical protein BC826DRAFT_1068958 [Russula brevipes]
MSSPVWIHIFGFPFFLCFTAFHLACLPHVLIFSRLATLCRICSFHSMRSSHGPPK